MKDVILANKESIVKILGELLHGKSLTDWSEENPTLETHKIINFRSIDDYPSSELPEEEKDDYINGTVNANFIAYSLKNGGRYAHMGPHYSVNEWKFYIWDYEPHIEEPTHMLAYHPATGRADILHMLYTAPDNWYIEKSTFLF